MNPVQIIAQKRDGRELTRDEIAFFIKGFSAGQIPNYQMSALAMAIAIKGMNSAETAALAEEMLASGQILTWPKDILDTMPRLEKATHPTQREASCEADDDESVSELDARDTVDLGDDISPSLTLMLDGSEKLTDEYPPALNSRDTIDLDAPRPASLPLEPNYGAVVDKHSTGGLGDKTSLILAPLLACCGLRMPMISGRGLGATGGTLDKLESIPGFRTDLSLDEIRAITNRVGCVITGATADIAPADRKLYALRDVTATVASVPLITASILSKKMAEGLDALLLDVKWGSGAFMKTLPAARKLAELLVETGRRTRIKIAALLTNMEQPLGRMVGNTLEIVEALDTLTGKGPADLWSLTTELAVELLLITGTAPNAPAAHQMIDDHITSGRALQKFRDMVEAQGGDLDARRPHCSNQFEVRSTRAGYVSRMNSESLGYAVIEMGGGRRVLSDSIDHSVGLEMLVRIGDHVTVGQPLIRVYCPQRQEESIKALIRSAIPIRSQTLDAPVLVTERIGW